MAFRNVSHKLLLALFAASVSACALNSCRPQEPSFLTIELCLKDLAGVVSFKREISGIARSQGLRVSDTSEQTEQDLDSIGDSQYRNSLGRPVVNMLLKSEDDIVATIGNIGLPSGQAALFFYDETDSFDSRGFAEALVTRLKQQWRIEVVPPGEGAQGMADCNAS
jgi:hypothetical protein